MPLSSHSLDNFVAPKLSQLTACGMPEIELPDVPLTAAVLDRLFLRRTDPTHIRLLTNTLRWMDAAFIGYSDARDSLTAYTKVPRGKLRDYYRTILRVEHCLAATDHSGVLAHKLFGPRGELYCSKGQNGPKERLRELYNTSKHIDGAIRGKLLANATIPIWLTNEGIESNTHFLTFVELAAFMQDFVDILHREFSLATTDITA